MKLFGLDFHDVLNCQDVFCVEEMLKCPANWRIMPCD